VVDRGRARTGRRLRTDVEWVLGTLASIERARIPGRHGWWLPGGRTVIAVELTVSPKTVSAYVEHILAKLGAARRAEIAAWAAGVAADAPA